MKNLSGAFEADGNLISRCENMFVQIVQFKLKPDTPREVFLDLAEQMVVWLKIQKGSSPMSYMRVHSVGLTVLFGLINIVLKKVWQISWIRQLQKKLICLIEGDFASFFGQKVIAVSSKKSNC